MPEYSKGKANLLWARVLLAKEEGHAKAGQGNRYDVADLSKKLGPKKAFRP